VLGGALFVGVLVAYQPAWHGSFLYEDELYASSNPLLTASDGLRRIWFTLESPVQYFPLTHTVFRVERDLWGKSTTGYHLVNIVLHAVSALLLWRLLRSISVPAAWFGAALFALHPIQVESVAQISEVKNVLSGLFFISSLVWWVKYLETRRLICWAISLTLCILALAGKTTACVLPLSLLLIVWWRDGRISRKAMMATIPFWAVSALAAIVAIAWERTSNPSGSFVAPIGWVERLLVAPRVIFFYLGKLLWPSPLMFNYPSWNVSRLNPNSYVWLLAFVILASAIYFARRRIGRGPEIAFLYFAGTLLPFLGLVSIYTFRYSYVADHYQYLACIGPLALLAGASTRVAVPRWFPSWLPPAVVLPILAALTWKQAHAYRNAESLWADTVAKDPASWMAENNYGIALLERDERRTALDRFERAYNLDPRQPESVRNVGVCLLDLKQPADALPYLREAVRLKGDDAKTQRELGRALAQLGRFDEASSSLQAAAKLDPRDAKIYTIWAGVVLNQGRSDEAMSHLKHALSLQPGDAEAEAQLANLFLQLRHDPEAAALLRQILELRPDNVDALKNYAWLLATSPNPDLRDGSRAVMLAEKAQRQAPQNPFIQATLVAAYAESGRYREALSIAQRALEFAETNKLDGLAELLKKEIILCENSQPVRDLR